MKKLPLIAGSILLLTQALLLPVSASRADFRENAAHDGYLVALADGVEPEEEWEVVLPGVIRTDDPALARALLADGEAEYAETNDVVRLFDTESGAGTRDGWVYEMTNAACAETPGLSGAGVRIAVIDSGVDRANGDLQRAVIEAGYDYLSESGETMCDTVGHGTQVVQMIAADRNDRGGTGIARGAAVVPLRCFSADRNATVAELARAIREAADKYDSDIINMSWGLKKDSQTLREAVRYAYGRGCILVAAAGNVSADDPQGTVFYPAAYDEVIGVGAVTRTGEVSALSQQTRAVSVCAPGEAVPVWLKGKEAVNSGTSFATPCVAAMLALARERLPSLDGAAALALVSERAVERGAAGYDTTYGYGTLDVRAMLGQSWGFCRQEGGASVLSGWLSGAEDGVRAAALYRQSGQMAACVFLPEGSDAFSCAFPGVTGTLRCRLFSLDADYRPAPGY